MLATKQSLIFEGADCSRVCAVRALESLNLSSCKCADLMELEWLAKLPALKTCNLSGQFLYLQVDGRKMHCTAPPRFLPELRHLDEHGIDLGTV